MIGAYKTCLCFVWIEFAFAEASTSQGCRTHDSPRDSDGASSQGLCPDLEFCYKTITLASLVAHTMKVVLRARQLDEFHVKSIWRFLRSFYSFWCIMSRSWIIATSWQWGLVSNHHDGQHKIFRKNDRLLIISLERGTYCCVVMHDINAYTPIVPDSFYIGGTVFCCLG